MSDKGTDDTLAANSDATQGSVSAQQRPRRVSFGSDYETLEQVDPKHYVLGQELARGGMGRIVRARDRRLGRSVAIKELLDGQDDLRFEREARITARLQHPSIVAVHEAGRWPSGEPFFAMKLVAGTPLDKKIATTHGLAERLALVPNVIAAADALAYAHSERVIHRDLKPSNVLCGQFGETVVIDWGLAKDLAAGDDAISTPPQRRSDPPYREQASVAGGTETVAGAVIGTPAYMPPEQAAGERVDARADVYALGAMLYHLLAGVPPYEGRDTDDVLARVRTQPPKPLAEREPDAPLELVAIVGKAMAREPDDRFATAEDMATELHRFATGKLVTSHRYTRAELIARWVRKHRAPVLVGAIAFAALAIIATIGIVKIVAEGRRADREAAVAQSRSDTAKFEAARAALDTDPSKALELLAQLGPGAPEWGPARTIAADAIARGIAHERRVTGRVEHLAFSPDGTRLAATVEHDKHWSIVSWQLAAHDDRTLDLGTIEPMAVGFAANGDVIHVAYDGAIARWSPASNIDTPLRNADGDYDHCAIAPTGAWIALFSRDKSVLVATDGSERPLARYSQGAWSPDGAVLVAFDRSEGRVDRIVPATLAATEVGRGIAVLSLATDGTHVWGGTYTGELYDVATGKQLASGHDGAPVTQLAALPDGDGAVLVATAHYRFRDYSDEIEAFAGDYALAITTGDASEVALLRGHRADVSAIAVTAGGRIASADIDGAVRVWQRSIVKVRPPDGHTTTFAAMGRSPGELVIGHRKPSLEVLDIMAARSRRFTAPLLSQSVIETDITEHIGDHRFIERIDGPGDAITDLQRSRDGARFVTLDAAKHVLIWDLDTGARPLLAEDVHRVAFAADGSHLATSSGQGVWLWDATTGVGKQVASISVKALALSSDGTRLAVATLDGEVAVLDATGLVWVIPLEREQFYQLAFSPDGRWLVAGGHTGKVRVFDLALRGIRAFAGHAGTVTRLVFDRDGTRLASTAKDHTVRVWSLADGSVRELRGHTDDVTSIVFDGDRLLTASTDRTARVWDLRSGDSRPLGRHADRVVYAGVAPNGQLMTIDHDDRHVVYPDDLPADEAGLRAWLARWASALDPKS